jgi:hypothetical protein
MGSEYSKAAYTCETADLEVVLISHYPDSHIALPTLSQHTSLVPTVTYTGPGLPSVKSRISTPSDFSASSIESSDNEDNEDTDDNKPPTESNTNSQKFH